eukprot:gnl/TRDRNA2_/TRDRNA2_39806_c0_seq1.p1 gnl/TRDRNA2_/TRDRNA2_39806_c0~~gnl/TRDRNA2_/TRDRNA2_39806_c0_seq1.p1  ORF type:complete len:393 (-),score=44.28 gnl/TRDRNA2_/TRDRNA2_39806_c0_seq1:27-1205(-)
MFLLPWSKPQLLVYFVCAGALRLSKPSLRSLFPFYLTTAEIHNELVALASRCPQMTLRSIPFNGTRDCKTCVIDVATVRAPDSQSVTRQRKDKQKVLMLFGEHAMELVSVESGLHLLKSLCGETRLLKHLAQEELLHNDFQIVVNGNPGSREKVEQGAICLRENPNGVDLNRNWDTKRWAKSGRKKRPGSEPFSEPETKIFRQIATEYKPTIFVSVHSGDLGMYMPWVYKPHAAKRNQALMMNILESLSSKYCDCPFGAGGEVHYETCDGTSIDWIYDKLKTPISFAFEIYTSPDKADDLRSRWREKMKLSNNTFHTQIDPHFSDIFAHHRSDFVELSAHSHGMKYCVFEHYNPTSEGELKDVLEIWSTAYLDLVHKVHSIHPAAQANESHV